MLYFWWGCRGNLTLITLRRSVQNQFIWDGTRRIAESSNDVIPLYKSTPKKPGKYCTNTIDQQTLILWLHARLLSTTWTIKDGAWIEVHKFIEPFIFPQEHIPHLAHSFSRCSAWFLKIPFHAAAGFQTSRSQSLTFSCLLCFLFKTDPQHRPWRLSS